jgi:hypothetical protein
VLPGGQKVGLAKAKPSANTGGQKLHERVVFNDLEIKIVKNRQLQNTFGSRSIEKCTIAFKKCPGWSTLES